MPDFIGLAFSKGAADADRKRGDGCIWVTDTACNAAPAGWLSEPGKRIDSGMLDDIRRTARAAGFMLMHLALALISAATLKIFEVVWTFLFPAEQPKLLGLFPFRWILDLGEAAIISVFLVFGVAGAIRIMLGR